jgi:uncharacterized membrane-anchored protein YitT (DUF2179 family)
MYNTNSSAKVVRHEIYVYFWMAVGAFLAAFAINVFLIPNRLIDGGIIGLSMILSYIFGQGLLPFFLILFTLPFLYMGYRNIGKVFLLHMFFAVVFFVFSVWFTHDVIDWKFSGESLEVVVIGGSILGVGIGLVIRYGGCLDGTEILGILINKRTGFSVGQVVLFCNIFVFTAAGIVFQDWHPAILSLITYIVASKVMDYVIVGLEETKSVLIISQKSKEIADAIIHELGLGLTVMYGRGGFTGDKREILYVIAERLQLAELKDLVHREDPNAFIAIENLHEVCHGTQEDLMRASRKKRIQKLMNKALNIG